MSYPDAAWSFGPGTWGGTIDNRYRAGEMWVQGRDWGPNRWGYAWSDRSADLFFKTYVDPVPEPGSLVLLASGLALLCRRRGRPLIPRRLAHRVDGGLAAAGQRQS